MAVHELHYEEDIPGQRELKFIDDLAAEHLPHDPTPSLAEIQAQPDVKPLGAPQPAPQHPAEPLRLVVYGSDAALSAVLTKLMRSDRLWIEVGFVPAAGSVAARNYRLPNDPDFAREAPVRPVPLIRDDAGVAVAGCAEITHWHGKDITGEAIVDDARILTPDSARGVRLVPTLDAPGIAAVRLRRALFRTRPEPDSVLTGRAVQAGGYDLRVNVDGVSRKRPVEKVTFYRHLRDLQIVRP